MSFVFWLLWVLNLLLAALTMFGSHLRSSFGASNSLNSWLLPGLIIILIASLIVRYSLRHSKLSLIIVALPFLILFLMYLIDKKTKVGE